MARSVNLTRVPESPLRVVVCEDDRILASLIESILEDDGRFIVVGRASNGDDAVRLVAEHRPDIVLMDISMPARDGIEATRAIHANDARQHVVIYTGSEEYADVARADEAGAAGFLHKDALTSPELADALHVLHTNYVRDVPDPE
jgi:two-component system, NarL family, response regulator DesR